MSGDFPVDVGAGERRHADLAGSGIDRGHGRDLIDAQLPPFFAVGRFIGAVVCTGSLILDPRIVVTAAHCVVERDGTLTHAALTFSPAGEQGSYAGDVWAIGSLRQYAAQTTHDASNDWAVVVLDQPAGDTQPFGLIDYGRDSDPHLEGAILLPAYGEDVSNATVLAVDRACSINAIVWSVLLHDCAATRGASGAPLLVRDGGWYSVVGINSGAVAFAASRLRPMTFGNAAVGSRFFSAAVRGVHERLREGLGPGCRFQWTEVRGGTGTRLC